MTPGTGHAGGAGQNIGGAIYRNAGGAAGAMHDGARPKQRRDSWPGHAGHRGAKTGGNLAAGGTLQNYNGAAHRMTPGGRKYAKNARTGAPGAQVIRAPHDGLKFSALAAGFKSGFQALLFHKQGTPGAYVAPFPMHRGGNR